MPASPRETVERFLRAAAGPRPGDLADCYAPEAVIEMPFAFSALYPARIETTREELRSRFQSGTAVRTYERVENAVVHETADPDVIITEYDLHGRLVATGEPFTLSYVMVMTFRDGLIAHTRDYGDPVAGAKALGLQDALVAAISGA